MRALKTENTNGLTAALARGKLSLRKVSGEYLLPTEKYPLDEIYKIDVKFCHQTQLWGVVLSTQILPYALHAKYRNSSILRSSRAEVAMGSCLEIRLANCTQL